MEHSIKRYFSSRFFSWKQAVIVVMVIIFLLDCVTYVRNRSPLAAHNILVYGGMIVAIPILVYMILLLRYHNGALTGREALSQFVVTMLCIVLLCFSVKEGFHPILKEDRMADAAPHKMPIYIPSGSFMPVVLLGGLDAGTGGQAQNNPWPVLMRVTNNATLPNRFRSKVKECFVLGSGYGDLSSERAYLRLESFSCVMKDGSVVDTQAKGYVAGEDGKAGMRGTLVTKQGQVLANALLSGIVGGIGQGISSSSQSYMTSALGTQYYIQRSKERFPVIEIDAARTADVVLTKGLSFDETMGKAHEPNPSGVNSAKTNKSSE